MPITIERDSTVERDRRDAESRSADRSDNGAWGVVRTRLRPIWASSWHGLTWAAAIAAGWGVIAGWWTPRGPLTTAESMWSIAVSLAVGVAAGFLARSRWAVLTAPVVFTAVFELVRLGTDGPLVDGPQLSTYGILALVVGRGMHGLLALAPMALGAFYGAAGARQLAAAGARRASPQSPTWLLVRRSGVGVATIALLALVAGLVRPASTEAIADGDGELLPGSIAELTTVEVNGRDLGLMIRGHSTDNPVLLFLAGGPGGSELGAMRNHLAALEEHFTVATWDQRGTGKSYPALDPTSTMTLRGAIDDTVEVTNHLRQRFNQDRIYLMGQSWGSLLGVLAVQEEPGLYQAYIGTGQMVSPLRTDTIFYEDTLAWAEATGRDGLADDLRRIGPPPYESVLDYETALSYEHEVYPYDHSLNSEGEGGFSENFLVPEYTLLEQVHLLGAFMDTFTVLYPQIQDVDFAQTATQLEIPVFFVQGAHEADGRAEPFEAWYSTVDAPIKDVTILATSGHRPPFEQPGPFVDYMVDTVLAGTQAS